MIYWNDSSCKEGLQGNDVLLYMNNPEMEALILHRKKGRKNEEKENVHYGGCAGFCRSHGDRMRN